MSAALRVERVVIVGRDASAWLTALALQRAFGRTGVRVQVVALPSRVVAADVYAAVPSLGGLHRLLGLGEAEVLEAASGIPVLGQRFIGWNGDGSSFVHAYDTQRVAIDDIDFVHFWVRARAEGLKVALDDFSLAAVAAKQGSSIITRAGDAGEAPISPGYHLDARLYVDLVRRRAVRAGVGVLEGIVAEVDRQDDRITAVVLGDGRRITGDLFIDASGAEAILAAGQPAAFDSWRELIGADRTLTVSGRALRPLPAFSQISAFDAGWIGIHPLKDRAAVVAGWDSRQLSDRDLVARLPALTGLNLYGEARVAAFEPGMRPAWTGNCIAIGEAAVALEPLDAVHLQLTHLGLSQLIALFPASAEAMPEARAYNAAFAAHVRNVRDFQLAHYRLSGREGEPFWDRARAASIPDGLETRIRLFGARGRVAPFEDESFQDQNWTAVFVGHGLIPLSYDPMVDKVPAETRMARFRGILGKIAAEVRAMPTVEAEFGGQA